MIVFFRVLGGFLFLFILAVVPVAADAAVHEVLPGESLYAISTRYGVSQEALREANGMEGYLVSVGQSLYIPDSDNNKNNNELYYTVKAGDTLYSIARNHGVNYQDIMLKNGMENNWLYVGMVLSIPAAVNAEIHTNSTLSSRGGSRTLQPEVELLARLITAEADGEPYSGKVAVGAVVLNRLDHDAFPTTIQDVIYQRDNGVFQFEPVKNGWIDLPATSQSYLAAEEALNGVDPTNGALYFFANKSNSKWLWSRPVSTVIGNTIFTY